MKKIALSRVVKATFYLFVFNVVLFLLSFILDGSIARSADISLFVANTLFVILCFLLGLYFLQRIEQKTFTRWKIVASTCYNILICGACSVYLVLKYTKDISDINDYLLLWDFFKPLFIGMIVVGGMVWWTLAYSFVHSAFFHKNVA